MPISISADHWCMISIGMESRTQATVETRIGDGDQCTIAPPSIFTISHSFLCFRQCAQTFTIQFCLFPFQSPPHPCSLWHGKVHTIQYSFLSRPMYLKDCPQ